MSSSDLPDDPHQLKWLEPGHCVEPQIDAKHKGWHQRGYLPHLDVPGLTQFVTWRLGDSLPQAVLQQAERELAVLTEETAREARRRKLLEAALDRGYGACWLKEGRCAEIVRDSLQKDDGAKYQLHAWVIMPNHVHVLADQFPGYPLGSVVEDWKGSTAHKINACVGRQGELWQEDYWDRYMRDYYHFTDTLRYIALNPVRAGLARRVGEWPWYWKRK